MSARVARAVRCASHAALACAALAAGCTVGSGTGSATGPLWLLGCGGSREGPVVDYGAPDMPNQYSLNPSFFAGEPIDSFSTETQNRLIIRMQRDGRGVEATDTMFFDVVDSFEVARCLRGATRMDPTTGQMTDDWDTGSVTITPDQNNPTVTMDVPWCDWSAGGDHPVIRLGPQGKVTSSIQLSATCPLARVVATAYDGTIEFQEFGLADETTTPAATRDTISRDFKVNFGAQLRATFHVVLGDERIASAIRLNNPIPAARIGGTLDGSFDFDFERGRAAQTFP